MKKCSIVLLSILVLSMFSGILDFGAVPTVYAAEDTFGKTDIGGSSAQNSVTDKLYALKHNMIEDGNVTSISWYGKTHSGSATISCGLYDDDAGAPGNLLRQTQDVTVDTNIKWWNFTFAVEVALTIDTYWITVGFEGDQWYQYDTGAANMLATISFTPPTFNDPFGSSTWDTDRNMSIYATYTITGVDSTPPTYSGLSSSSTTASSSCQFSATFDDETALPSNGQSRFATNNTGEWIWDTPINFTSTPQTVSTTKTLNSTVDMIVGYRWNITDNVENLNYTSIQTLTITDAEEVSLRSLVFVALSLAITAISLVIVGWKKDKLTS